MLVGRSLVVGLMSGTSLDGVDAALVAIERNRRGQPRVSLQAFRTEPYPRRLSAHLLEVAEGGAVSAGVLSSLHAEVGECLARAALRLLRSARVRPERVALIGSHGHTVHHRPAGHTLQIGAGAVIAARTGITTVADFRVADIAQGGEGAPLTAYAHHALFSHRRRGRAIQNLGGIANVTYLPPGGGAEDVVAFDTGPGNMVIDGVARALSRGRRSADLDGAGAARGRVDYGLMAALLRHPYFSRRPPKSTGREEFGRRFVEQLLRGGRRRGLGRADLLATATALTAESVRRAYRRFLLPRGPVDEVYLAGGGRRNRTLARMLAAVLPAARVEPVDVLGIDGDALEAVAFALLAECAARGIPANLPAATGAARQAVLGAIFPGRRFSGVQIALSPWRR